MTTNSPQSQPSDKMPQIEAVVLSWVDSSIEESEAIKRIAEIINAITPEEAELIKGAIPLQAFPRAAADDTGLILSDTEVRILTDHHYYEADKAITRLGCRVSEKYHLKRLAEIRAWAKSRTEGDVSGRSNCATDSEL